MDNPIRRSILGWAGAAVFLLLIVAVSPLHAAVELSVTNHAVVMRGVTPGGQVVLFGRSCVSTRGKVRLMRHALVQRDDDADGVVTVAIDADLSYSAFVAVDYESGQSAASAPGGATPVVMAMPRAHQWHEGAEGVDLNRGYLDFLVVRPRKGAWIMDVVQGTARDADGVIDGILRLRVASMQPLLGKEPPPSHVAKKDILAVIDPRDLDVLVIDAE